MHKVKDIETSINYLKDLEEKWIYERETLLVKEKKHIELDSLERDNLNDLIIKIELLRTIIEDAEIELSVTKKMKPADSAEDIEIPLAEWARLNNVAIANARQRAHRGSLKSAHKVGNIWMIKANEPNNWKRQG